MQGAPGVQEVEGAIRLNDSNIPVISKQRRETPDNRGKPLPSPLLIFKGICRFFLNIISGFGRTFLGSVFQIKGLFQETSALTEPLTHTFLWVVAIQPCSPEETAQHS